VVFASPHPGDAKGIRKPILLYIIGICLFACVVQSKLQAGVTWGLRPLIVSSGVKSMVILLLLAAQPNDWVEVPFQLLEGGPAFEEPVQAVIRDTEEWAGLFETFTIPPEIGMLEFPPSSPDVDFGSEMLIVLGIGRRADVGGEFNPAVAVEGVLLLGDSLFISFSETPAEPGLLSSTGGFVYPVCMAVVQRLSATPVFVPNSPRGI
jgi:hypothetical protein